MSDYRDWEELRAGTDCGGVIAMMADRASSPGLYSWVRVTRVDAYGLVWVCLEAWLSRPEDEGPQPTAADVPVGFS